MKGQGRGLDPSRPRSRTRKLCHQGQIKGKDPADQCNGSQSVSHNLPKIATQHDSAPKASTKS